MKVNKYGRCLVPRNVERKMMSWFARHYLDLLAKTESQEEFFEKFGQILKRLSTHAGAMRRRNVVEMVRKIFEGEYLAMLLRERFTPGELERLEAGMLLERLSSPHALLARLLIQRRLSKSSRDKLAEVFFSSWELNAILLRELLYFWN